MAVGAVARGGGREHRGQGGIAPPGLGSPRVELVLNGALVSLSGSLPRVVPMGSERLEDVGGEQKGVPADGAQKPWPTGTPHHLEALCEGVPQPDHVVVGPVSDPSGCRAVLPGDRLQSRRIGEDRSDLPGVSDDARRILSSVIISLSGKNGVQIKQH